MAAPKPRRRRKKAVEPAGLAPAETKAAPPATVRALGEQVESDGGALLAAYREPLGGRWLLFAALPLDKVEPTPYQRDVSPTHARRLTDVIEKVGRFLDPIIAVRREDGRYWTPNGNHRCHALRAAGGRTVTALVVPEESVAFQILALNTEKGHNLREKSLEVIRMARALAGVSGRRESDLAFEFEEAPFLTLGVCYEASGRFGGGAYHAILRRIDRFLDEPLPAALEERERRGKALLELDAKVAGIVEALKERGFRSPYLRPFVVARINPLRFRRGASAEFDETLARMVKAAAKLDPSRIRQEDLARASGPPEGTGE